MTIASWAVLLAALIAEPASQSSQPSLIPAPPGSPQSTAASASSGLQAVATGSSAALDFEFFRTRIQPIFLAKRPGHARCISCHATGTPMRLQPLAPGRTDWTEEESRKNFEAVRRMVVPGSLKSMLLIHPLAPEAGGDIFHNGGKHWSSQSDPEWQTLAAWVRGEKAGGSGQ